MQRAERQPGAGQALVDRRHAEEQRRPRRRPAVLEMRDATLEIGEDGG